LLREAVDAPAIAIGVDLIGGDLKTSRAYLAVTKRLRAEEEGIPLC